MFRLALFDLDNTLINREALYRRWAAAFIDRRGLEPDDLEWLCQIDRDGFASRQEVFSQARRRWLLVESVDELIADYRNTYPTFLVPDPDVNDALQRLRLAGVAIAVVTNGPPSQREKMERADLARLVDACCVSDEVGVAKPDRGIFDEALLRCGAAGLPAREVVVVGDTPVADVGGGTALGFWTIWMHRGRRWKIHEFQPDASVATVAEAVEAILGA